MPLSQRKIRVPVKLVDGRWEVTYGGPVRVEEGAVGELHLDRGLFNDKQFLAALTQKRQVEALPEGTELRVALTVRELSPDLERHLVGRGDMQCSGFAKLAEATRFVAVFLDGPTSLQQRKGVTSGGLTLILEGMEPRAIETGQVALPGIPDRQHAESLNHAFTLLSEVFEPWRQAHTGSIYERVFYRESDGLWYPLDTLRNQALVQAEREVISALWDRVAQALGTALL
ncbi:MAG: hypothetical protein A2190_00385 [Lysobacterales bacterium RIFOXYA1_FULL_69_10]|nr:MAG: hypothetical protein A2190_00385 [Xanthomonadales bacterium RIFOXYA1_FULL_69_10]